jgi:H+/Cl- antiporter ClcA
MIARPIIRVALFGVIVMLLLYGLVWPALVLIAIVGLFFNAYEYIFVAFCIDCYFAPDPWALWYTLVITGVVVGAMIVRPYMRVAEPSE